MESQVEFKRRIDSARNILVGVVPSPAGQIDQITYAMIYKFISDIDDKTARLPGGKRQYFVGEYERFDWHNLMRLDGQDKLNLYRDALASMSKNPHLPELFRTIYQNAFLPFNDPRTLNLFLKEIDGFTHTKSDAIGDAYEYLLNITGAQGDVGQFRTPRHIIRFIVDAVQPGKDDTVLDPAAGTAGFLIAAYNYVRRQHDGIDENGEPNGEQRLSADERKKLYGNYHGYDIDPTMVRTASVNMYLHGFSTPNIEIHDTLTSEEHWANRYDVILANPPFMTPKGGIEPHGKFGVKAKRAEVLFVDYIASHLKPTGRAGIVVPEGIIFQSGKAYKELRKNLVENYLYAVVSLPAGMFQPYSGVKTSVLLLDKELAQVKDEVLFVKVENDGYSTGANRREIAGSQFPEALQAIERFKHGEELQTEFAHAVPRSEIAESGDYNLSGDRYKVSRAGELVTFPLVELGDDKLFVIESGGTPSSKEESYWGKGYNWATLVDLPASNRITCIDKTERTITENGLKNSSAKLLPEDTVLISSRATIGRVAIATKPLATNQGFKNVVVKDREAVLPKYVAYIISSMTKQLSDLATGGTFAEFSKSALSSVKIPLPPIETQREIVAELDGYQRIIDAAQTIIKSYKPTMDIKPEWEVVKLGDVAKIDNGNAFKSSEYVDRGARVIRITNVQKGHIVDAQPKYMALDRMHEFRKYELFADDLLMSLTGNVGRVGLYPSSMLPGLLNQRVARVRPEEHQLDKKFLFYVLNRDEFEDAAIKSSSGIAQKNMSTEWLKEYEIPLPPVEIQREIVAELEFEQTLIDANKKLIEIYQQKIKSKIAEIWGE